MWKAFAKEDNRQMLADYFLLYEAFSVAKSPINMISIIRVSGSVLARVACTEKSLLAVAKAALCSCPHWKLVPF